MRKTGSTQSCSNAEWKLKERHYENLMQKSKDALLANLSGKFKSNKFLFTTQQQRPKLRKLIRKYENVFISCSFALPLIGHTNKLCSIWCPFTFCDNIILRTAAATSTDAVYVFVLYPTMCLADFLSTSFLLDPHRSNPLPGKFCTFHFDCRGFSLRACALYECFCFFPSSSSTQTIYGIFLFCCLLGLASFSDNWRKRERANEREREIKKIKTH